MQRNVRALQCRQKLFFALGCRVVAIVLGVGIEPPDAVPDTFPGLAPVFAEGAQYVNQSLAMNPTQGVIANPELTGAIRADNCALQQAYRRNPVPQGPHAGEAHRVGMGFKFGKPERFKMRHPCIATGKEASFMSGQLLDEYERQVAVAHIIKRRVIDLVALITGAQQFQKVWPALALRGFDT